MNITKTIYSKLDTKFWNLKRYKDYFYAFHSRDRAIYKLQENTLELAFEYPKSEIWARAFDIYQDNLLAGTKHGELVLWNMDSPKPKQIFTLKQDLWISSVKFLDAELVVLACNLEQTSVIYTLSQEKIIDTIPSGISDLRDAQHNEVLLFDKQKGLFLYNWRKSITEDYTLEDEIISPVISPDGRFIVVQNSDDLPSSNIELLVYERETMRLLQRIDTLSTSGGTLYLIFDDYLVATMPDSSKIGIWDIQTGQIILIEEVQLSWINHLAFDSQTRELVIGSGYEYFPQDYCIEIWKIDF